MKVLSHFLLPLPTHRIFWFITALAVKSLIFSYTISEFSLNKNPANSGWFALWSGDSRSYVEPIENLLASGNYESDYRMPGYGWIYFLLRVVFPVTASQDILVVLQLILSSLSVYYLAMIALFVFKKNIFFYLTFILFLLSTFVSLYDPVLRTESFCASSLILSMYFLVKPGSNNKDMLIGGLFLTWSIFLRPVCAPILLLYAAMLVYERKYIHVLLFLSPFLILDGVWTIRNYIAHKGFYPLTTTVYYPEDERSYVKPIYGFMNAFGGSTGWWRKDSEMRFFMPDGLVPGNLPEVTFPENIYTVAFNYDSLLLVKRLIEKIYDRNTDTVQERILTGTIREKLGRYTQSVKEEKPFLYYITSRIRVLKTFFVQSGTGNLFAKPASALAWVELGIKIFYTVLYGFVVVAGFCGCLVIIMKTRIAESRILSVVSLYLALVYPLLLKMDEERYFVTAYPFLLVTGIFFLVRVSGKSSFSAKNIYPGNDNF